MNTNQWLIQGDPTQKKKKTEPINFFITSTKVKQNNSNSLLFLDRVSLYQVELLVLAMIKTI